MSNVLIFTCLPHYIPSDLILKIHLLTLDNLILNTEFIVKRKGAKYAVGTVVLESVEKKF